jgi:D-glycero-alpha-D-manno-heptose-7-phosphate kinase
MSSKISLSHVDSIYDHVRSEFGVLGGKLIGAGGGGFLMLYCPEDHLQLEEFMREQGMPRLHYSIEHDGCAVVTSLSRSGARSEQPVAAGGLRTQA